MTTTTTTTTTTTIVSIHSNGRQPSKVKPLQNAFANTASCSVAALGACTHVFVYGVSGMHIYCCVWCQACVAAHTACNVMLGMHVLMAWQLWMLVCNYVSHYTCNIWCGCCHTSAVTSNAACWCRIFAIRNPGHCCRHPASTHTWCCEMHLKKTKLKHTIACKQLAPAAILSWHTSQSNFWSQSCCWWQCLFTSWFNLATYICFCQEFHEVCIWRITCRPCTQRWSWCASTTLWKFLKFCIKKVNEKGLTACRPHTQRWSWCASTILWTFVEVFHVKGSWNKADCMQATYSALIMVCINNFVKICQGLSQKEAHIHRLTACRPHTQRWSWCASTIWWTFI